MLQIFDYPNLVAAIDAGQGLSTKGYTFLDRDTDRNFQLTAQIKSLSFWEGIYFEQGISLFGIVTGEEKPSVWFAFSGAGKVKTYTGHFDLEGNVHSAGHIRFYKTDIPFEVLFEWTDGYVLVVTHRYRKPGTGDKVFGILRNKRRGVVASGIRNLEDFGCPERFQINPGYTGCIVTIAKCPAAIVFSFGCGQGYMVKVIPGCITVCGRTSRITHLTASSPHRKASEVFWNEARYSLGEVIASCVDGMPDAVTFDSLNLSNFWGEHYSQAFRRCLRKSEAEEMVKEWGENDKGSERGSCFIRSQSHSFVSLEALKEVFDLMAVSVNVAIKRRGLILQFEVAFAWDGAAGGTVLVECHTKAQAVEALVADKGMPRKASSIWRAMV